ncbi:hypothetical protein KAT72_01350 [Aeromonas popoffii]|uniref:Uncharacterized protein n=1 Tax=Aeromonas popoffii TaxID=70856 RepID=A0ABS5GKP8_9GAMM|nr:hypothetical protein [Aeromonas popoffii]MBR7627712.1 hypothetical protein [Aeromonas popoffii]
MNDYYIFQDGSNLYAIKNTQNNELEMLFLNAKENGRHLVLDKVSATSEDAAVKIVKKLKAFNVVTSIVGLMNIGWILGVKETPFNMVIFIAVTIAFLWGANAYQKMLSPELKDLHKNKGEDKRK